MNVGRRIASRYNSHSVVQLTMLVLRIVDVSNGVYAIAVRIFNRIYKTF